jgi:hypothetical protein
MAKPRVKIPMPTQSRKRRGKLKGQVKDNKNNALTWLSSLSFINKEPKRIADRAIVK